MTRFGFQHVRGWWIGILAFALAALAGLLAGRLQGDQLPNLGRSWYLATQAIPTTATDLSSLVTDKNPPANATVAVCTLKIVAAPNASANVSIYDKQGGYLFNAVPIPGPNAGLSAAQGQTYTVLSASPLNNSVEGCHIFPGGLTLLASGSGIQVYMSGRW